VENYKTIILLILSLSTSRQKREKKKKITNLIVDCKGGKISDNGFLQRQETHITFHISNTHYQLSKKTAPKLFHTTDYLGATKLVNIGYKR